MRCAHCQVYLPRDEAVESDGRSYCSREHAEQLAALLVQSRFRGHQAVKQQRVLLEQALGMAAPEWLEYWDESSQVRATSRTMCVKCVLGDCFGLQVRACLLQLIRVRIVNSRHLCAAVC